MCFSRTERLERTPKGECCVLLFVHCQCTHSFNQCCGFGPAQKWRKFKFWSARCSPSRDEDFSCSLNVLYGGLGIRKLQFCYKKMWIFFSCKFFPIFGHPNPGPGSGSALTKNTVSGSYPDPLWNQFGSATLVSTLYSNKIEKACLSCWEVRGCGMTLPRTQLMSRGKEP